jgi:hypothetical protein
MGMQIACGYMASQQGSLIQNSSAKAMTCACLHGLGATADSTALDTQSMLFLACISCMMHNGKAGMLPGSNDSKEVHERKP